MAGPTDVTALKILAFAVLTVGGGVFVAVVCVRLIMMAWRRRR